MQNEKRPSVVTQAHPRRTVLRAALGAGALSASGLLQVSVVNMPLGRFLPDVAADHLPTMFKSRDTLVFAMRRSGFAIEDVTTSRAATLIQARK